jgi:3-deoxy-D-manno-octulosonic acid (KDO) 8-phosphate synthase
LTIIVNVVNVLVAIAFCIQSGRCSDVASKKQIISIKRPQFFCKKNKREVRRMARKKEEVKKGKGKNTQPDEASTKILCQQDGCSFEPPSTVKT